MINGIKKYLTTLYQFANYEDGIINVSSPSGKALITTTLINVNSTSNAVSVEVDASVSIRYPLTIVRMDSSSSTIYIKGINNTSINGGGGIAVHSGMYSSVTIAKNGPRSMVVLSKS